MLVIALVVVVPSKVAAAGYASARNTFSGTRDDADRAIDGFRLGRSSTCQTNRHQQVESGRQRLPPNSTLASALSRPGTARSYRGRAPLPR